MGETVCASCGVVFWLTDHLEKERRDDHRTFYCPNGHALSFGGPSANEKRITQLEGELRDVRRANTERLHELLARKSEAEHLLTRCPLCLDPTGRVNWRDETNTRKLVEHLQFEHGARARLRALPPGESVAGRSDG